MTPAKFSKFYGFTYEERPIPPSPQWPDGSRHLRPTVKVMLQSTKTGKWLEGRCLVDSGATLCAFPMSWAKRLGLNPEEMPESSTAHMHELRTSFGADFRITLPSVPDITFTTRGVFCDLHIDTNYGELGVLGQIGFFENFRVMFDASNGRFYICAPE